MRPVGGLPELERPAQFRPKGAFKTPYARNMLCGGFGGSGGGSGAPSTTSVLALIDGGFGGSGGGKGAPSAYCVRSIVTGLPAVRLTERTTSSTIKTANTETATASVIFFKGGTLLEPSMRRESFGGVLCLEMFRLRNTGRHENAYTASAKPQSHSGFHPDNSCGHSRAISPADLYGFLAGSLERPI